MPAQKQLPVLKVMYLFAGRQRHSDIGSFLRKAEESGHFKLELMEFHIERSPDQDLSDRALWDRIIALLKEGDCPSQRRRLGAHCINSLQHF